MFPSTIQQKSLLVSAKKIYLTSAMAKSCRRTKTTTRPSNQVGTREGPLSGARVKSTFEATWLPKAQYPEIAAE